MTFGSHSLRPVLTFGIVASLLFPAAASAYDASTTLQRVSVDVSGIEGDDNTESPVISSDGQFIAFTSFATNLVPGDTNDTDDVFRKNIATGAIERASVSSVGDEANNSSFSVAISASGRYITFTSAADNLVPGDTNGNDDIFIKDMQTGVISLVSTDSLGNPADGPADNPAISADGRYVAYLSYATNMVAGDTNGFSDVILKDTLTGASTRVSTDSVGTQGNQSSDWPAFSGDGQFIGFSSRASNLVAGDTNTRWDVFRKDLTTGQTLRVSTDSTLVEGNGHSDDPTLSIDGRYVAFSSVANNLVSGDTNGQDDVFMKDTQTGLTTLVSSNQDGVIGDSYSTWPHISDNGRFVAFQSDATNLIANDANGYLDIFVKDTQTGSIGRFSTTHTGAESTGYSGSPSLTGDATGITFFSAADDMVPLDENFSPDAFYRLTSLAGVSGSPGSDPEPQPSLPGSPIPAAPNTGSQVSLSVVGMMSVPLIVAAALLFIHVFTKSIQRGSIRR